jgi:hypothetical protein
MAQILLIVVCNVSHHVVNAMIAHNAYNVALLSFNLELVVSLHVLMGKFIFIQLLNN